MLILFTHWHAKLTPDVTSMHWYINALCSLMWILYTLHVTHYMVVYPDKGGLTTRTHTLQHVSLAVSLGAVPLGHFQFCVERTKGVWEEGGEREEGGREGGRVHVAWLQGPIKHIYMQHHDLRASTSASSVCVWHTIQCTATRFQDGLQLYWTSGKIMCIPGCDEHNVNTGIVYMHA